jgi:hypothetical protein
MAGGSKKRQREAAVEALLTEATLAAAAARAMVSERTLKRWLGEDPDFQAAYRRARMGLVDAVIAQAQKAAHGVMGELLRVAVAGGKEADRVRASLGVLDRIFRGVEVLDLEARLAALEGTRPEGEKGECR